MRESPLRVWASRRSSSNLALSSGYFSKCSKPTSRFCKCSSLEVLNKFRSSSSSIIIGFYTILAFRQLLADQFRKCNFVLRLDYCLKEPQLEGFLILLLKFEVK